MAPSRQSTRQDMQPGILHINRNQGGPSEADKNRIQDTHTQITNKEHPMKTEAQIRRYRDLTRQMLEMPGRVSETLEILPLSHIVLLTWVLEDGSPQQHRTVDSLLEDIEEEIKQAMTKQAVKKTPRKPQTDIHRPSTN
jgi:hypothetical protein